MVPLYKCLLAHSKLHLILAGANLLAHNNKWLCYYGQVNSVRLKWSVASKWVSKTLWGVPFILMLFEHKVMQILHQLVRRVYLDANTAESHPCNPIEFIVRSCHCCPSSWCWVHEFTIILSLMTYDGC